IEIGVGGMKDVFAHERLLEGLGGPERAAAGMDGKLEGFAARIKGHPSGSPGPGTPGASRAHGPRAPGNAPSGAVPFPRQSAMRAPPTQAPERVMQPEALPSPFGSPHSGASPRSAATQADREWLPGTRHAHEPHTRSHP